MADVMEPNTAAGGTHGETEMLEVLGRWDDAFFNQDVDALKALLADDVVQHADHIVTEHDQVGPEAVASFHANYFNSYQFKHLPVVRAVNEQTRSVYSLWDEEKFDEELPASGSMTSISGMWRLVLDQGLRVRHIWFLRSLTREEKKFRLKLRPSQLFTDFRAKSLVGPTLELEERQVEKMHAAAEAFNEAWRTGDVRAVHDLMAESCFTINPCFSEKKSSRTEWEEMVQDVFKFWEVDDNEVDIAVTPSSNKAFLFWRAHGVQKDTQQKQELFGLNLLCFDPKQEMKIVEVVGFRQPLASEHDHIFKAGSYLGSLAERQGKHEQRGAPLAEAEA